MPAAASSRLSLGPFVGLNYFTFYGSDAGDANSRVDFAVGGQLDYDFAAGGLFRTGLIYSRQGAEMSDQGTMVKFKINYIEVPLLFGYRFPTSSGVRPYLLGGGQLGFKVGCSVEGSQGSTTVSFACDDPNLGLDVSSFDFELGGGAGLAFPAGSGSFTVDARYMLGLTKVVKDAEVKNRGFTFGVAYMFPIGR
jgi:hypothetical protein